jgi:hypothetical protein
MDDYCPARSGLIPPLPWLTFSPPFSIQSKESEVAQTKVCLASLAGVIYQ